MLPNFICVGPGRSGTTWLYEVFLEHPQIGLAKNIKETQFFNENWHRGLGWYEAFFEDVADRPAVGEISNRYIFDPQVARRIVDTLPDCRILVCVRNPYQRIQSNYLFKRREGQLSGSLEEAIDARPDLIEDCRYSVFMARFLEMFSREKVFFVVFDDIAQRPDQLCRDLFRFLGVDAEFVPSVLHKKINEAILPRFQLFGILTKFAARVLRSMGLYRVLTAAKRSNVVKMLLFRPAPQKRDAELTAAARSRLDSIFAAEIAWLEKTVGRDFSMWLSQAASVKRGS